MERIRQEMAGYRMPSYVEEILTQNYCKNFIRMTIVRDGKRYSFSYKPENYTRINAQRMKLHDKLLLIRNLIGLIEESDDHLISPESYLIEPELVYQKECKVDSESIKLLFYPDIKHLDFRFKIVIFADRILDKSVREEREMAERIRESAEPGDINRIKLFLDKHILRLEADMADGHKDKTLRT